MKIFISHSSKQKLFVKELRRHLPSNLELWIDEKEITIGESIVTSIEKGIKQECDFFLLVIDEYSVASDWVQKEIHLAIEQEDLLKRNFFLPIVLDKDCWLKIDIQKLKEKKYLYCYDFTDSSIEKISKELVSELFSWLSKEFVKKKEEHLSSSFQIIQDADKLSKELAEEIRTIVHPYRKNNPLKLSQLSLELNTKEAIKVTSTIELLNVIDRLSKLNFLNGIFYDDDQIYLSQEKYTTKSSLYHDAKRAIAKKAFSFIESNQIIGIDGGSTALEVTRLICKAIKQGALENIKIITNSIPGAHELLSTLGEMGARDFNDICNVYLIGGYARPTSFNIITEGNKKEENFKSDPSAFFDILGQADMCFVGANGVNENFDFANHNKYEVKAKTQMIENSKRKFIIADASKFQVRQETVFAKLSQGLEIITFYEQKFELPLKQFKERISNTSSQLIFA